MDDEYISKRAFNDVLYGVVQKYSNTSYNGLDEIARQVAHMDAADVAPVRHGRWKFDDFDGDGLDYQCSLCRGYQRKASNYCPNCGAKMDKEETNG